jgi:hypothetical protein
MATPVASAWNIRSIAVSLLEPNWTAQSLVVIAAEPGRTAPKSVAPAVPVVHPLASMLETLGTLIETTTFEVADSETPTLANTATHPATTASNHAIILARANTRMDRPRMPQF